MHESQFSIQGGQKYYEFIDFLKGFSILSIVLVHLIQNYMDMIPEIISKLATVGSPGVHIFILCSGFGLYLSYKKRQLSYFQFLKKRFGKIYVPYIIVVLVSFFVPFMYTGNNGIGALLSHIFLYKMFVPEFEMSFGIQFWYISTLFQLYFLFIPLCKLKARLKSRKKFWATALVISVAWWIFIALMRIDENRIWGSFCLQYLWEFALGMCIADYLSEGKSIKIKKSTLLFVGILGLGISTVAVSIGGVLRVFNDIPSVVGYGAVALLIYSMCINFLNKIMLKFSAFSYEWYLLHILVFSCCFQITISNLFAQTILALIAFLLSILASIGYSRILHIKHSRASLINKLPK